MSQTDDVQELFEFDVLPSGFLEVEFCDIRNVCPKPSLIRLRGKRSPALFISILLHGNEDAGLLALQDFFRAVAPDDLERDLTIFVGNVEACEAGVRFQDGKVDFNRAWPGSDLPLSKTHDMLAKVVEQVVDEGVFASIDIHNNTGRNPEYGCICSLDQQHVNLASLFSEKIVYFTRPKGVQTQAFLRHCPAVTLECGQIGSLKGAKAASLFLQKCMQTESFEGLMVGIDAAQDASGNDLASVAEVYRTVARIRLQGNCSVGFESGNDIVFREDLDLLNFRMLPAGEPIGRLNSQLGKCLIVKDQSGNDVTSDFLQCNESQVSFGKAVMPSMLTKNLTVMRQDCVGYLMETIPLSARN